jgi:hypothetical protein
MRIRMRFLTALSAVALSVVLWNGCLALGGDCTTDSVTPVNVIATAGENGRATISWEIPPYDTTEIQNVYTVVKYDTAGGEGSQCNTYDPNSETHGCATACDLTAETQCTATGLKTGVAYTFTVITQSHKNPYCGDGTAFVRTQPVIPVESVIIPTL